MDSFQSHMQSDIDDIKTLTKNELKNYLNTKGLSTEGSIEELRTRYWRDFVVNYDDNTFSENHCEEDT